MAGENVPQSTDTENIEIENVVDTPEKEEGLSLRQALEVAHTAETHVEPEPEKEIKEEPKVEAPTYNAPSEWNNEEKADFLASSRKQQEAALRLHKSRSSKIEEIRNATNEYRDTKALAESIAPYIKAMGLKESPQVALQKATALWKDFEYAEDPKKAAAQYLLAKGIEPPKDWLESKPADVSDEKYRALQERQDKIENRLAQEERAKVENIIVQHWQAFEQTKNASGNPRYPDLAKPIGPEIADSIGSLVRGDTELSKQFIARAQRRIPDCTPQKLIEEAYRLSGGQVDDFTAAPKSQSANNHLQKAKRASSSRPGGSHDVSVNGSTNKKLPLRSALERAVSDWGSEN